MTELNYSNVMVYLLTRNEDFQKFQEEYSIVTRAKNENVGSDEYGNDTRREFKRMSDKARKYLMDIFPNEKQFTETKSDEDVCTMFFYVFSPLR